MTGIVRFGTQSAHTFTFSGQRSSGWPACCALPPNCTIQPSRRFGFGLFVDQSMRPGNDELTGVFRWFAASISCVEPMPSTCTPPEIAVSVWAWQATDAIAPGFVSPTS